MTLNEEACRKAAQQGYANATELADYLVAKNIPFRTAHDIAGKAVVAAIEKGLALEDMPIGDLQAIHSDIQDDVFPWLALDAVLDKRDQLGGTSKDTVTKALYLQLENWDALKAQLK